MRASIFSGLWPRGTRCHGLRLVYICVQTFMHSPTMAMVMWHNGCSVTVKPVGFCASDAWQYSGIPESINQVFNITVHPWPVEPLEEWSIFYPDDRLGVLSGVPARLPGGSTWASTCWVMSAASLGCHNW